MVEPGSLCDRAVPPVGSTPVKPASVVGEQDRPGRAFPDRQVMVPAVLGTKGVTADEQWKAVAACGAAVALVPRSDPHYGLGAVTPVLATNRHGIQEAISFDKEFEYGLDLFTEMRTLMTV